MGWEKPNVGGTGDPVPSVHTERARLSDTGTDPDSEGEFRRDGADVKVHSGGEVRNLSNFGSAASPAVVVASKDARTTTTDFVCDGTDDQTTINDAIATLPSGGGTVVLSEGTFNLSGAVTAQERDGIRLCGQGYATHLFVEAGVQTNAIDFRGVEHVEIAQLRVNGNEGNQQDGNDREQQMGIRLAACSYCHVHHCAIENTVYSALGHQAGNSAVEVLAYESNYVYNTRNEPSDVVADGIRCSANGSGRYDLVRVTDNVLDEIGHSFVEIDDSQEGAIVTGNICRSSKDAKRVNIHGGRYGLISNNYIEKPSGSTTAINTNSENVVITNNVVRPGAGHGIRINTRRSTSSSVPSRNIVACNSIQGAGTNGIQNLQPDIVILGNQIDGSGAHGIRTEGNDCIVTNNRIKGSGARAIADTGTGSVVNNNITGDPN